MEEDYLDYEDDMDRMLDEELEIQREAEMEKENAPASRKSLQFGKDGDTNSDMTAIPSSLKPHETNVFANNKRSRISEDSDLSQEDVSSNAKLGTADRNAHLNVDRLRPEKTPTAKRQRVSGAGDFELDHTTNDVLADVSNVSSTFSQMSQLTAASRYRVPLMGERKVYKRIPLDSDYVSVTVDSGERFYLRMKEAESELTGGSLFGKGEKTKTLQPSGLCGVPFHKLLQEAEMELEKLKSRESESITAAMVDSGIESADEDDTTTTKELWVEKFKPRCYMDLLSDVGTNRTLLKWLKLWDRLVFGKDLRKGPRHKPDEAPKFQQILPEVIEELDELHRPKQHVALLHGPPGLGKTTLAHIVARHAGYNIVEMNASDDRSVDAFKKKLESSTQMRSVLTEDQRPNCLIIDEIDGAPAPTINFLVSVLSGKVGVGKKKDKKSSQVLRPVICICNELYTPSLRPLRQIALVIPFPPTSSVKLAERLKEIALKEKLSTDLTALLALCKKSDNDIRSCLSTLQFFNQRGKVFRAHDVASVSLGSKDTTKSLFSVWQDIFSVPGKDAKQRGGGTGAVPAGKSADDPAVRMKHIQTAVARSGETDRIMTGVFENYLSVPFKNIALENVISGCDWFCYYDLIHHEIMHSQNYSIMGHLAYPLVKAHFLYAVPNRVKLSYPTQATDLRNKMQNNLNVLETITNEMLPSTRAFCANSVLVRELLPFLLSVVQPVLRPINTQLYSAKEKADLKNLVNIHIAYNISYQQERNMEGQYEYKMDPDVESVVAFPGIKRPVDLTYAAKQLIAHEIELERMRRIDARKVEYEKEEAKSSQPSSATPSKSSQTRNKHPSGTDFTPKGSKSTQSHLVKLTPKQVVIKEKQATDFFGRVIKVVEREKTVEEKKNDIVKTDVWFKFKEGYSNAVRRNVKIKDFM